MLDKIVVPMYYGTIMNYVATNLRFPRAEYEEIKKLAFIEGKSVSAFIREATRQYKDKRLTDQKSRRSLFDLITKASVKIDIPVAELIETGRHS